MFQVSASRKTVPGVPRKMAGQQPFEQRGTRPLGGFAVEGLILWPRLVVQEQLAVTAAEGCRF